MPSPFQSEIEAITRSPFALLSVLDSRKVPSPLLSRTLIVLLLLTTATSARPSWLTSPTARQAPPPGEVTGARKAGTVRASSVSTFNRVGAGWRRVGVGEPRRRHT